MENEIAAIQEYRPAHRAGIDALYRNWFTAHFQKPPEPVDELFLLQPEKTVLEHGGAILVALDGEKVAGMVALKKADSYSLELTKMAVAEEFRGQGLGEALCKAAVGKARSLGAKRIVLYSHRSLQPALHLYRKIGFEEVPLEEGIYSSFRCDVKMEMWIDQQTNSAARTG